MTSCGRLRPTTRASPPGVGSAVGASARDIVGLVVLKGLKLSLDGIAIGAAAGALVTRSMSSLLFGVSSTDIATFAMGASLLLGLALLASCLRPRRASDVDPIRTLRTD